METNGAQTFGQFLKGYFKGLVHMLKHPLAIFFKFVKTFD